MSRNATRNSSFAVYSDPVFDTSNTERVSTVNNNGGLRDITNRNNSGASERFGKNGTFVKNTRQNQNLEDVEQPSPSRLARFDDGSLRRILEDLRLNVNAVKSPSQKSPSHERRADLPPPSPISNPFSHLTQERSERNRNDEEAVPSQSGHTWYTNGRGSPSKQQQVNPSQQPFFGQGMFDAFEAGAGNEGDELTMFIPISQNFLQQQQQQPSHPILFDPQWLQPQSRPTMQPQPQIAVPLDPSQPQNQPEILTAASIAAWAAEASAAAAAGREDPRRLLGHKSVIVALLENPPPAVVPPTSQSLFVFDLDDTLVRDGVMPPATKAMLICLQQLGQKTAIASFNLDAPGYLRKNGADRLFDCIVWGRCHGVSKAHHVATALDSLGFFPGRGSNPGAVYFFDDQPGFLNDVRTAFPGVASFAVPSVDALPAMIDSIVRGSSPRLREITDGAPMELLYLGGGLNTVAIFGRDPGSDVVMKDQSCAMRHANLQTVRVRDSWTVTVTDLRTYTGTFIDDTRIEPDRPYQVVDGQRIRFGNSPTVFFVEGAAAQVYGEGFQIVRQQQQQQQQQQMPWDPRAMMAMAMNMNINSQPSQSDSSLLHQQKAYAAALYNLHHLESSSSAPTSSQQIYQDPQSQSRPQFRDSSNLHGNQLQPAFLEQRDFKWKRSKQHQQQQLGAAPSRAPGPSRHNAAPTNSSGFNAATPMSPSHYPNRYMHTAGTGGQGHQMRSNSNGAVSPSQNQYRQQQSRAAPPPSTPHSQHAQPQMQSQPAQQQQQAFHRPNAHRHGASASAPNNSVNARLELNHRAAPR